MKLRIALALFCLFFLNKTFTAQTQVSGGIYANTTWTLSNSPYLMTGSIVVFPGATLTIEPGVEVRVQENGLSGTQYYLETRGTINMVGTEEAPITFRADTALTTVGAWQGFKIKNSQGGNLNFNYINVSNAVACFEYDGSVPAYIQLNKSSFSYNGYAVTVNGDLIAEDCLFSSNENAVYGWANFTFSNCVFDKNSSAIAIYANSLNMNNCEVRGNYLGIGIYSGSVTGTSVTNTIFEDNVVAYNYGNNGIVESCTFIGNGDGIINTTYLTVTNSSFFNNTNALQLGFGSQVNDCTIEENETGVAFGPINFGQPMPIVENNRICSNTLYNIDNRTDLNIFIPTNCFCTTDSTEIETKIFDGYDDITKGLVSYAIFDTACANVLRFVNKSQGPTSVNESEWNNEVRLFPNPAADDFTIFNNGLYRFYTLTTLDGKELMRDRLQGEYTTINSSQLPAGIYLMVLQGEGDNRQTLKVVRL